MPTVTLDDALRMIGAEAVFGSEDFLQWMEEETFDDIGELEQLIHDARVQWPSHWPQVIQNEMMRKRLIAHNRLESLLNRYADDALQFS